MSGATWVLVVVGLFGLVIVTLVVLLIVGAVRGRTADPPAGPPENRPHPRGEAIPPTGSR